MMKLKLITILTTSLLVFLTGCDNLTPQQTQQALHQPIQVENVAWMREKLPEETLAYARIPTLWQLLFEAKADGLHPAQKLEAHKKIVQGFKKGIIDAYAKKLPQEAQFPFETLLKNMSSPLEIAVLNATDGSMVPNVMIATTLESTTKDQLNDLLALIAKESKDQLRVTKSFDDNNFANVYVAMAPVFISFEEKTGHLLMLSGLTASQKQLQSLLAQTKHATQLDDIFAFEDSIDVSGNNIETWFNLDAIYQQNKGLIPASELPMIEKLGVDKMKFLWVGTASNSGKSELIFKLAMPETGIRNFIAGVDSQFDVQTAGTPRSAWQFTRPTVEQFVNGFEFALTFAPNPDEIRSKAVEILDKVNGYLGITIAQMMNIYGRKIVVVTDDSGTWFASKILDKSAHNDLLERFKETFKLKHETKSLAGVKINEMITSSNEFSKKLLKDFDLDDPSMDFFDYKQKSYYLLEGDTYIQAFVPQVLADRSNSNNKMKLSSWVKSQQGQKWDNSLLSYTTQVQDAPRSIYYFYLKMLEVIGSLAQSEVDLFTMPTAQQLDLPEKGQFSFALDANGDGFSIKLSYEYSIFENMSYFDGYIAIVYLGVLSAYAIPAYRDYTLKAKVLTKMHQHSGTKALIGSHYTVNNSFPDETIVAEYFQEGGEYQYDSETGKLTVYFSESDDASLQYDSFEFVPEIDEDNEIYWACYTTVYYNLMPDECYELEEDEEEYDEEYEEG